MATKVELNFTEIARRLKALPLPDVDLVVGIARGGVVPASLAAYQLDAPLQVMRVQYRADDNRPLYAAPRLLAPPALPNKPTRILLVDDVSVTGHTLDAARVALAGHEIVTLVCKGQADHVLFPEIAECVAWPWQPTGG